MEVSLANEKKDEIVNIASEIAKRSFVKYKEVIPNNRENCSCICRSPSWTTVLSI